MTIVWERRGILLGAIILAASLLVPLGVLRAETLPELVNYLAQEHNLVKAAEEDVNAARQRARVALGDWFPELDVSASYGFEDQIQPGSDDTRFATRDLDLKVTQLLWDFGKTNAALRKAGLVLEQTLSVLDGVRQNVLLRGVTAYLNISRRIQVLEFAKRSEENIKKQTDLESALVKAGKGFSTDVLQAKARLAGAEARRIDAFGRLQVAKNDYRALFEREPDSVYSQGIVHLPYESLPLALDDAVETAIKFNPGLKSEAFGIQIADEDVNSTRADSFFPRLQGVLEQRYKKDFSGTDGFQRESLGKVELTFPFNLGLTSVNRLRAAKHDRSATVRRVADRKDIVEQQTRNAWVNLLTARQRTASLRNQAEIVLRFLGDARKERKAGRRSLLDVLDGETQLLNAQSDAASAEVDEAIAIFTLFEAMGKLKESHILGRKSGEYLPEPRLNIDDGDLQKGGIETRGVRKTATPAKKAPEGVSPLPHQDQADDKSKVETNFWAYKETMSGLVTLQRGVKQIPEAKLVETLASDKEPSPTTDPVDASLEPDQVPDADSGLSGAVQTAARQAEDELDKPALPTVGLVSTVNDLLGSIGQFFEAANEPAKITESNLAEIEAVESNAAPETIENSPIDTTAPAPASVNSEAAIFDLLAAIGRFFEAANEPAEITESKPAGTEAVESNAAHENTEVAVVTPTEPEIPFVEIETAFHDLMARIEWFFESVSDSGNPDETVSIETGVAELSSPPEPLE